MLWALILATPVVGPPSTIPAHFHKRVSLIVDDEVEYFKEHQEKLVEESSGKVLVIKDQEVIGVYDSELDAYHETDESHEPGTFLIQRAQERERAYTQTFHSRVVA